MLRFDMKAHFSLLNSMYVVKRWIYTLERKYVASPYVLLRCGRGGSQTENEVHPQQYFHKTGLRHVQSVSNTFLLQFL